MASLRWLVEGTEAGDYRYFHCKALKRPSGWVVDTQKVSGHGISYESTVSEGKVAQVVPAPASVPGDYHELQPETGTRVTLQVVRASQLKYYNEAHRTPGLDDFDDNRIHDRELNNEFARLPKHSFLTVSLDSCHSGRMISMWGFSVVCIIIVTIVWDAFAPDNNYKLAGAGLRGRLTHLARQLGAPRYPIAPLRPVETPVQPPTTLTMPSLSSLRQGSEKLLMTSLVTLLACSTLIFCAIASLVFVICWFTWAIPSAYILKGFVVMTDRLPDEEQRMDNIKATV
ncbi:hypothetical protein FRC11_012158, partial [Ceratobasidium sp. 423]